ncbi:hypothetical protein GCM10020255_098680 [Rhodococcus baikonurensis]
MIDMISAKAVILGAPFDAAKPLLEERGITVVTVDELRGGTSIDPVETAESDIALQQLTSGSTGSPKAVQITHENFYTNAYAMINRIKFSIEDDVMVSWLPLFHDMGMVGFLTVPMQVGAEVISITPMDFLRTPVLWAELMGKYGGTVTAAPNFAYSSWLVDSHRQRTGQSICPASDTCGTVPSRWILTRWMPSPRRARVSG